MQEVSTSIFQLNRGFFYTVKVLSVKPGHSIRDYLEGKRKQYYKPLAFLLVTSALYVLVSYLIGKNTFVADFISGWENLDGDQQSGFMDSKIFSWLSKHQTYITLSLLPVFSIASYLSFKKSKYNYVEHLVLNSYITGQQMIVYLLLSFLSFVDHELAELFPFLIGIAFNFWAYLQFFEGKKLLTKILLTILTYLLFAVQFTILFLLLLVLFHLLS